MGMTIGTVLQLALFRRLEDSTGVFSWKNNADARVLRLGLVKQEVISWSPRIILFRNFLSPEECDYLIAIARPRLGTSTVVDVNTGKGIESKVRTSTSMFLTAAERKYPMIEAVRLDCSSIIPHPPPPGPPGSSMLLIMSCFLASNSFVLVVVVVCVTS
ncbi:hypothetical protein L7F22_004050 [Adiantum nelumboides]|nr:hypothetical protein [Adiantum nelumboides]